MRHRNLRARFVVRINASGRIGTADAPLGAAASDHAELPRP